jgi:hypothetical protein
MGLMYNIFMLPKIHSGAIRALFLSAVLVNSFGLSLSYAQEGESYTVNVPNAEGGYTPLVVTKSGSGYVGPQGEYYAEFPSVAQLQVVYGLGNNQSTAAPQEPQPVTAPAYDDPRADPRVDYFYDALQPYGRWIKNDQYGWVWSPNMSTGWRPYTADGYWVLTDYGWTWTSNLPWGWACFHYGRWFYDDYNGWLWYPDTVWAPSWVTWRYGGDWVGWAPLPPEAVWREDTGIEFIIVDRIPSHHFNFCHLHDFTRPDIGRHLAASSENTTIINFTNITNNNLKVVNHHLTNQLPVERDVIRVADHPVTRFKISSAPSATHHGIEGNELKVFRPQMTPRASPPVKTNTPGTDFTPGHRHIVQGSIETANPAQKAPELHGTHVINNRVQMPDTRGAPVLKPDTRSSLPHKNPPGPILIRDHPVVEKEKLKGQHEPPKKQVEKQVPVEDTRNGPAVIPDTRGSSQDQQQDQKQQQQPGSGRLKPQKDQNF